MLTLAFEAYSSILISRNPVHLCCVFGLPHMMTKRLVITILVQDLVHHQPSLYATHHVIVLTHTPIVGVIIHQCVHSSGVMCATYNRTHQSAYTRHIPFSLV